MYVRLQKYPACSQGCGLKPLTTSSSCLYLMAVCLAHNILNCLFPADHVDILNFDHSASCHILPASHLDQGLTQDPQYPCGCHIRGSSSWQLHSRAVHDQSSAGV